MGSSERVWSPLLGHFWPLFEPLWCANCSQTSVNWGQVAAAKHWSKRERHECQVEELAPLVWAHFFHWPMH